jgi:hypothetical protein
MPALLEALKSPLTPEAGAAAAKRTARSISGAATALIAMLTRLP